jgi:hypothetical protein
MAERIPLLKCLSSFAQRWELGGEHGVRAGAPAGTPAISSRAMPAGRVMEFPSGQRNRGEDCLVAGELDTTGA